METLPENAVLLIVDVQKGLDDPYWGQRNNPQAEANMARLLAVWRASKRPVFHVQHMSVRATSPLRPGLPGNAIKEEVQPQDGEPLFTKSANSAFVGTDLEQQLRARGYDTLVIIGLTTPHCVSSTARMAGNFGFRTYVVADATAAHELTGHDGQHYPADVIHAVALAELNDEFATVVETNALLTALS
jgi:nicotinamidase-related amidase